MGQWLIYYRKANPTPTPTPNPNPNAQVGQWLIYYRKALHGVSLEELVRRSAVLTRTSRGLRTVRTGYACYPYQRHRAACPRGAYLARYSPASGVPYVPCTVAPQAEGGAPARGGGQGRGGRHAASHGHDQAGRPVSR